MVKGLTLARRQASLIEAPALSSVKTIVRAASVRACFCVISDLGGLL
jgi:hypothetical protein